MDVSTLIAIIGVVLIVPGGVASIFAYRWLERTLENRKLIKSNESREQAISEYDLIKGIA
jgi:hypothetical protein